MPRTIPAWAGETPSVASIAYRCGDYPRVGGGDDEAGHTRFTEAGPSPRGRGRHQLVNVHLVLEGSIPAWAGETSLRSQQGDNLGTIPAWAGETHQASRFQASCRDHPRVGGGDQQRQVMALTRDHPRVGGGDATVDCRTGTEGTIPAWAGETLFPYR